MKKWLSNMTLRAKIFIIATPLTLALIISVVINAIQVRNTSKSLENIYFKTLYEVNNYLLNADRDYYQALCGATSYYNFTNGFTDATPELIAMIKDGYLDNYKENLDQVEDRVKKAIAIAKTNDALFTGTRHVDENGKEGKTFKEVYAQFESDYSDWKKTFNVEGNTGDWSSFNTVFDTVRENLNQMQEITEKWATDQSKALTRNTQSGILTTIIVFSILIIALLVFTLYITQLIRKSADATRSNIDKLASGDLRVKFADDSEIGSDELGSIEKSAKFLCNKLVEVMTTSNTMANQLSESGSDLASSANQASQASDQVTSAVSEIAKGAVSQADNVRSASNNTENIGSNIETIVDNVKEMDAVATDMKSACDNAMDSLDKLIRQSAEVTHSVKEIGDTINSTNDSAKKISEFTQAITDISAQTNLLSLNASIEAARAGDAGRGFAVVADEIRQLADQSKESADKIKGIVEQLLADSASSVSVLEKLNESFGMQAEQLESTKSTMEVMNGNVSSVRESSASISKRVASLDDAKNDLTNIVADLSAISEENAASTQETNASMEELNSTFTIITDSAAKLQNLAKDMTDTISFFKL